MSQDNLDCLANSLAKIVEMGPSATERNLDATVFQGGKGSSVRALVQMVPGVRTAMESVTVEVPSATPLLENACVPRELRVTTIVPWDIMAPNVNYPAE